ncbi:methyltransferase domain-containing protein [candidate division KSB1 bacterium]|nr:methyltransferase domain-containing protein [candidate division KSB1 bacterium]
MIKNPNRALWNNYDESAVIRGRLVAQILSAHQNLRSARILDIGCGTGGAAVALARAGARVKAIDPDPDKIRQARQLAQVYDNIEFRQGDISNETGPCNDGIILNDVLEHVDDPDTTLGFCGNNLKKDGLLYIATPNKYAPLNILCDPHYSLPFVALLSRKKVKRIVVGLLKWQKGQKRDFPQLLSFRQIEKLLEQNNFDWDLVNTTAASMAFREPEMLWSRQSHLFLIKTIKMFKLGKIFLKLINNRKGFFNKYINPSWFILAKRI